MKGIEATDRDERRALVTMTPEQLDSIASSVPGGADNIQDIYPLTSLQEGMLFHYILGERGDAYIVSTLLELESGAKLAAFRGALQRIVDRHDIFRTGVLWEGLPHPVQVVYRRATLVTEEDSVENLRQRVKCGRERMDLRHAPMIRLIVAPDIAGAPSHALLQVHHLVIDHSSYDTVAAEVMAILDGKGELLPPVAPYRAHVAQMLAKSRTRDAEAFFRKKLRGIDEPTAPFRMLDVHGDGSQVSEARMTLGSELAERARRQARCHRITVAALFHSALALVIAHTSGRDDVVFGTMLFGRLQLHGGVRHKVGMYLNMLPMRFRLSEMSAAALAQRAHRELLELLEFEQASLAAAQRCSDVGGAAPLFTTMLNFRHSLPNPIPRWSRVPGIRVLAGEDRTNYPITVSVDDVVDGFILGAQTHRPIDPHRMLGYLSTALCSLVEALESAPEAPALGLSILPDEERKDLIERFNATTAAIPDDKLIHDLFDEQALRSPDAQAVLCADRSLTYRQLSSQIDKLARYLSDIGVGPTSLVALFVAPSPDRVVGLLSVLKAGAAYLLLDPDEPRDRLAYLLKDARPDLLLTHESLLPAVRSWNGPAVLLDRECVEIGGKPNALPRLPERVPGQLAYVAYTAGATSDPKGVMVEHRAVLNLLNSLSRRIPLAPGDRAVALTPVSFDPAVLAILWPLLRGATVSLEQPSTATVLLATPGWCRRMLNAGWQAARDVTVLCTGAALSEDLAAQLATRVKAVWNLYGTVETTTCACLLNAGPVDNVRAYVLDRNRQPVPIGVVGEIWVAGAGCARGYLHRPDLTAECFVTDPFSADGQSLMFGTGDLGRWRADGTLELVGRSDRRVSSCSDNILLDDIEAHLARHPDVAEAVVVAHQPGSAEIPDLAAYVIPRDLSRGRGDLNAEKLRDYLKAFLPERAIPRSFDLVKEFPLSAGRLDVPALPRPVRIAIPAVSFEAPEGDIEIELARLWAEILRVDRLGRADNFFALGGHSLLCVKVINAVAARFGVQLPAISVFRYPTVKQMSRLIESLRPVHAAELEAGDVELERGVL